MIKEICKYIENGTSFVIGTTLFEISIDAKNLNTYIVVAESGPGLAHGTLTDYRQIPLTVYSRALTRFTARDNAYTVFDFLHGKMQVTLPIVDAGNTYVCDIECRTPYYIGLDEANKRHTFAMPIDVTVTNMT